jgi:hypothetical protein
MTCPMALKTALSVSLVHGIPNLAAQWWQARTDVALTSRVSLATSSYPAATPAAAVAGLRRARGSSVSLRVSG